MTKSRLVLLCAGLSLMACGGEAPSSGEEGELDTNEQAMTNINHCATGTTPNATSTFPGTGWDFFDRPMNTANPGGPCGSSPRHATYVEFTAPPGNWINFSTETTFVGTPNGFCGANSLVMKVEKFTGGAFQLVDEQTEQGAWQGSQCNASLHYPLTSLDTTGRYRVRAVASRWDGLVGGVRVLGDDLMD